MLGREALRAVQEQDRRAFAGLEQLKLDAGDSNDLSLQGSPPQVYWFHLSGPCVLGHATRTVAG